MAVRSLKNNFLFLLASRYVRTGSRGPYHTELIYEKFSDIRDENISADLESLQTDGFVVMTPDGNRIYLTEKGISQVEFLISINK